MSRCTVCPHLCTIEEGMLGLCGARGCVDGEIVDLNYGESTALALDPIEKKPLQHFHPGSLILSYGSFGCNMRCPFCQNADISMADARSSIRTQFIAPETLVEQAQRLAPEGNLGIALTYNEPLIAPEYLTAVGKLLKASDLSTDPNTNSNTGLKLVVVTNGYITPQDFSEVIPYIDAMNIDLKCFTSEGYERLGAPHGLATVLHTIEAAHEAGIHVEVTTLVVPGLSDDAADFERECAWLAGVSPDIPLHITRFFPTYKMYDATPTSLAVMEEFQHIAKKHLNHVHLGNV